MSLGPPAPAPWKLRAAQLEAFALAARERFERRMAEHLRRYFPRETAALGSEGTQAAIRHGIARAAAWGIDSQRDVCRYLEVMTTFGRGFDADPAHPWARAALAEPGAPAAARVERLVGLAVAHVEAPSPPHGDDS